MRISIVDKSKPVKLKVKRTHELDIVDMAETLAANIRQVRWDMLDSHDCKLETKGFCDTCGRNWNG